MRTEFSGAGTAEEALMSSAVLYNSDHNRVPISIDFKSIGDWAPAARQLSSVNHPSACQFGDIMGLVPEKLKEKLTEPISEKVTISARELRSSCGLKNRPSVKAATRAVNSMFKKDGGLKVTGACMRGQGDRWMS